MRLADVEFTHHGNAVIARLVGEVDLSNAQNLGGAIAHVVPNHSLALVLDLSGVDFIDSAGIQLIYQLRESLRARDQALRLVVPASSPAQDALRLAGIASHIETLETVDDAVRELT